MTQNNTTLIICQRVANVRDNNTILHCVHGHHTFNTGHLASPHLVKLVQAFLLCVLSDADNFVCPVKANGEIPSSNHK